MKRFKIRILLQAAVPAARYRIRAETARAQLIVRKTICHPIVNCQSEMKLPSIVP